MSFSTWIHTCPPIARSNSWHHEVAVSNWLNMCWLKGAKGCFPHRPICSLPPASGCAVFKLFLYYIVLYLALFSFFPTFKAISLRPKFHFVGKRIRPALPWPSGRAGMHWRVCPLEAFLQFLLHPLLCSISPENECHWPMKLL